MKRQLYFVYFAAILLCLYFLVGPGLASTCIAGPTAASQVNDFWASREGFCITCWWTWTMVNFWELWNVHWFWRDIYWKLSMLANHLSNAPSHWQRNIIPVKYKIWNLQPTLNQWPVGRIFKYRAGSGIGKNQFSGIFFTLLYFRVFLAISGFIEWIFLEIVNQISRFWLIFIEGLII